jgi:hypothetical protein
MSQIFKRLFNSSLLYRLGLGYLPTVTKLPSGLTISYSKSGPYHKHPSLKIFLTRRNKLGLNYSPGHAINNSPITAQWRVLKRWFSHIFLFNVN